MNNYPFCSILNLKCTAGNGQKASRSMGNRDASSNAGVHRLRVTA